MKVRSLVALAAATAVMASPASFTITPTAAHETSSGSHRFWNHPPQLSLPAHVLPGERVNIGGTFTSKVNRRVLLQRRAASGGAWTTIASKLQQTGTDHMLDVDFWTTAAPTPGAARYYRLLVPKRKVKRHKYRALAVSGLQITDGASILGRIINPDWSTPLEVEAYQVLPGGQLRWYPNARATLASNYSSYRIDHLYPGHWKVLLKGMFTSNVWYGDTISRTSAATVTAAAGVHSGYDITVPTLHAVEGTFRPQAINGSEPAYSFRVYATGGEAAGPVCTGWDIGFHCMLPSGDYTMYESPSSPLWQSGWLMDGASHAVVHVPDADTNLGSFFPVSIAPALTRTSAPSLRGAFRRRHLVSVSTGTWSPSATRYSYRWFRGDGTRITRSNGPTLRLSKAEVGKRVYAKVTAIRFNYRPTTAQSAASPVVTK